MLFDTLTVVRNDEVNLLSHMIVLHVNCYLAVVLGVLD